MKRILLLAALLAAAPAAALPIIDVSISAGLNHSRVDANTNFSVPTESYSGTEPRVTFNASVTTLLAVELGWSKLASNSTVVTIVPPGGAGGGGAIDETLHESGSVLWLAYAPSIRLGALELAGKLGAARLKRDLILTRLGVNLSDISDTEVLFGAAGTYWFKDTVGLRLDAEQIGSDVTQMGLSLTIGF